jgi:hypothetical protein
MPVARKRHPLYLLLPITAGLMIAAVLALSAYQIWVMNFGPDAPAYSLVIAGPDNLPPGDARGAYLQLDGATNQRYPTNLVALLETETPGVVAPEQAPHVAPNELRAVVIRQSVIADSADYRVYRIAAETYPMGYERLPTGTMIRVFPEDGVWRPGNYIVDIPANGTFGGRSYYSFMVDEPAK